MPDIEATSRSRSFGVGPEAMASGSADLDCGDGAKLFSAGSEGIVRVIDADSDTIQHQWKAHDDWIDAIALSPDGQTLATGDWAGTVKLWDVRGEEVRQIDFRGQIP